MTARRVAGWTAVIAGAVFVAGMIAETIAGAAMMGAGQAGNGMMPSGQMGGGMMGMDGAMMGMGNGLMPSTSSSPSATAVPGAMEVKVQATNYTFTPNEIRLPKKANVNLTFTNAAGTAVVHDLTVPALGIHVVTNPGETKTIGLSGLAAGRYDAYCSVSGHADLGMRATVIVE